MTKNELLKKFVANQCNAEEAQKARQYLDEEPGLLDTLFPKNEWDNVSDSSSAWTRVEKQIKEKIGAETRRPVYRMAKNFLSAAAVMTAIGFGLVFYINSNKPAITTTEIPENLHQQVEFILVDNYKQEIREIKLADNSTISLYPGSSVAYSKNFRENRTIRLSGKAIFKVEKNPESPFAVQSGTVKVMALGTRFLVDSHDPYDRINVQLFEGKVVVQPADPHSFVYETFLEPGQQCFVDPHTRSVKVKPIRVVKPAARKNHLNHKANIIVRSLEPAPLEFSKTPMPEVLARLEAAFHQTIHFNEDQLKDQFFTGSFRGEESLASILAIVSKMNGLSISGAENEFRVERTLAVTGNESIADSDKNLPVKLGAIGSPNLLNLAPPAEKAIQKKTVSKAEASILVLGENEIQYTAVQFRRY